MKRLTNKILATLLIVIMSPMQTIAFQSDAPLIIPVPSPEEEGVWNGIKDRIVANKAQWTHNIDDVLGSFGNPINIIIDCKNSNKGIKQVRIQITSTFINWTNECGNVVGCYMWKGSGPHIENGNKSIFSDNMLILNYSKLTMTNRENLEIGQIDNEGIVFHELLHGQLLIDAMKNDENWRSNVCNCSADIDVAGLSSDGKSTPKADKVHQKIYDLQDTYVGNRATAIGGTIIKRTYQINADANGDFKMDLNYEKELKDKGAGNVVYWISPVENILDLNGQRTDYKIKLGGKVKPGKNQGRVRVLVDPEQIGVIDNIRILVPAAAPTIPPGHSPVPQYSTCEGCHASIRGSSLNLPGLLILGICTLIISLFMIKRKRN